MPCSLRIITIHVYFLGRKETIPCYNGPCPNTRKDISQGFYLVMFYKANLLALPTKAKDLVLRFIIEYSSFKGFWPLGKIIYQFILAIHLSCKHNNRHILNLRFTHQFQTTEKAPMNIGVYFWTQPFYIVEELDSHFEK
jgi:hypothetical protein